MDDYKKVLLLAGNISFALALFQVGIGFSKPLSLYFGAPKWLAENGMFLLGASLVIAIFIAGFGAYAVSGAGRIRRLPWLKQGLCAITGIYIVRGMLVVPEYFVLAGILEADIPVAFRFLVFSVGSLSVGLIYLQGTVKGWHNL